MSAPNTTRWIGIGLLGLPLFGALTFWSSIDAQPDPNTRFEAWSRYVTTDHYVLTHLFGSILGLILAIFGTFALGPLPRQRPRRAPGIGGDGHHHFGQRPVPASDGGFHIRRARGGAGLPGGHRGVPEMPTSFVDTAFAATSLLFVLLLVVGNVLLGVAVWRSGTLPRWAGAFWAAAAVLMYPLGIVYAATIGPQSNAPTVLVGALLIVISGAWMAFSVLSQPSVEAVGAVAQARVR